MGMYYCPKCGMQTLAATKHIAEYECWQCLHPFIILEIDRENLDYPDLIQALFDSQLTGDDLFLDGPIPPAPADQGPVASPELKKLFDEVMGDSDKGVTL